MGRLTALILSLFVLLLAACERGPDEALLRGDMQGALEGMENGLLRIVTLNPQGIGPAFAAGEVVAYANVTLELERDHNFGGWDGPTIGTLASTLGATDKGIHGIRDGGNAAGDRLHVYASAIYAAHDDGWRYRGGGPPMQSRATPQAPADEHASLVAQFEAVLARMQANDDASRARLLERTLTRALADIQQQMAEVESAAIVAGGPIGGEYAKIAAGLRQSFAKRGMHLAVFHSDGSIENARLVHTGDVALGIVQSDVLALAQAGQGPFATGEPLFEIAALAALYPEPVHVVVPAESPVKTLADLADKRVALGPVESGTRYTAARVLSAHGVEVSDLGRIDNSELETAASRLARGEVDAMFATIGAPAGALRRLAARRDIRLLPLDKAVVDAMTTQQRSYVRYVIPRSTYGGQQVPVPTIATTAVLVAGRTAADDLVESALEGVFLELDYEVAGSLQGGMISLQTAKRGLPLALHRAAERFYASVNALSTPSTETVERHAHKATVPLPRAVPLGCSRLLGARPVRVRRLLPIQSHPHAPNCERWTRARSCRRDARRRSRCADDLARVALVSEAWDANPTREDNETK